MFSTETGRILKRGVFRLGKQFELANVSMMPSVLLSPLTRLHRENWFNKSIQVLFPSCLLSQHQTVTSA